MPFLGQQPAEGYQSIAKQTITGNGGTSYALNYKVTSASDIAVFINNVRQEPDVTYTASGTTITFSDAVASSDSCYIVFQARAVTSNLIESQNIASGAVTNAKLESSLQTTLNSAILKDSATGAATMPVGTTAQRPGSPVVGMQRMNTTTGYMEYYGDGGWQAIAVPYSIEYVVVGGGGSGGSGNGGSGGGGAGGYIEATSTVSPTTNYAITIGAGGAGTGDVSNTVGSNGTNTTLNIGVSTLTSIGGGGGGAWLSNNGLSGGSGGGGGGLAGSGGSGTAGQGNAGGNGVNSTAPYAGGGGGGAGGVGGSTSGSTISSGGIGKQWLNGTYYAGGGGAGTEQSGSYTLGNGGVGGGGRGGYTNVAGTAGSSNTGGGGGGGGYPTNKNSGSGGSGIVIIRYAGTQRGSGGTVTSSGGYTYHTFTSSGTFTA